MGRCAFWSRVCLLTVVALAGGTWILAQDEPFAGRPEVSGTGKLLGIEVHAQEIDAGIRKRERELTVEAISIVAKYGQTKDAAAQTEVQQELRKTVEAQFDLRQASRTSELKELEEQLKRLRGIHDQRTAERDRIVQDRVHHLLREASGLGWGMEKDHSGNDASLNAPSTGPLDATTFGNQSL